MVSLNVHGLAGRYAIDVDQSSLSFTTRHLFGLGKVTGSLRVTGGTFTVAEPVDRSAVEVHVDAGSFATRNPLRDFQVRSPLFLRVRGREAPVDITVTRVEQQGTSVTITGKGRVDRYAHGVKMVPGMAARHLDFELTVVATRVGDDTDA